MKQMTFIHRKGEIIYSVEERDENEELIKFTWKIPVFGSPEYTSNIFTVVPKELGG